MSAPDRPTRVNRKAVLALGAAKRMSLAMAMIAPGARAHALDRGDDRLRAGAHRPDQVAGHPGEAEQAVAVHLGQRADDLVDVAARAEIAAGAADDDALTSQQRSSARNVSRSSS